MFDKLIELLNLNIQEFQFQYHSHPNYPSALAFSDTLRFMGLKNEAYELDKKFWDELPNEFITIYKNNFSLIKKQYNNSYKIYSDKIENISKEHLFNNSKNFIILFEKEEIKNENNQLNFNWFLFTFFSFLLFYSIFQFRWYELLYNLFSIIGIYISLEIFNRKFGKASIIINNLCGTSTTINSQNNCTKIIDSDKINILGLKLSDFSLVYFIGILTLGLFFPYTTFVLKFLSVLSVLVILYSLFVQVILEKKFCKICLFIIFLLTGQIIFASFFINFKFDWETLFISALVFFFISSSIIYIKVLLKEKEEYKSSSLKNLKFRRNYEIFKRELLNTERVLFSISNSGFFFGNQDSKIKLTIISNPYCGFCKDAHKLIERILQNYPEQISLQIRFNVNENKEQQEIISIFDALYQFDKNVMLKAVEFWYEKRDLEKLKKIFNISDTNYENIKIYLEIGKENFEKQFNFTPIILINGFQFPQKYERSDINYFIDELLEDEEIK